MNVPAAVSSLFRRRPDEWLPLFWLAAACVLGLVWSLVHASGLVAGVPLPWPAGRLMFSFYGALVYGWALPVLFSFMAENGCRRLKPAENGLKIPHVGWNTVGGLRGTLLEGIDEETYVYYVHSYAAEVCEATIARTDYGGEFSAALGRGNFFGTQFHPEKSGSAGERILRNFLKP